MPLTSGRQVSGPTIPSTVSPSACWKLRTAGRGLGPEDPVDREAVARAAGLVAEPELLLQPADRVTGAAAGQHDDQGAPRLRPDDPVDVQLVLLVWHRS